MNKLTNNQKYIIGPILLIIAEVLVSMLINPLSTGSFAALLGADIIAFCLNIGALFIANTGKSKIHSKPKTILRVLLILLMIILVFELILGFMTAIILLVTGGREGF